MKEIKIFNNKEFGEIRTTSIDGEPWFVGKDVCEAFGDTNYRRSLSNIDDSDKGVSQIDTHGGKQNMTIINESGLYCLLFQMQPQKAKGVSQNEDLIEERIQKLKRFKHWVTSEVLPTIRKTGSYQKPLTQQEMMRIQLGMIDDHEGRISNLENTMTIDYGQQRVLESTVSKTVIDVLGGKESCAYRQIGKKVFAECNSDLKKYFNVNARNNIPKLKFDDAVEYAKNWKPCTNTMMLINDCNAQMVFE